MTNRAAEFLVIFLVKLVAALVESHKKKLKDAESLAAFEAKVELARAARTQEEAGDAADEIRNSFRSK